MEKDVIRHHPDLTILMVGKNDMLNSKKMMPYYDYAHNLNLIVKILKDKEIKLILMTPPPVDAVIFF